MVKTIKALPPIPEKLFFTISEASKLCGVKPHVLRYWEQEFSSLRPAKRRGGRRNYQRKDIEVIRKIRELLYQQGFTITGAKQQLHLDRSEEMVSLENTLEQEIPRVVERQQFVEQVIQPKAQIQQATVSHVQPTAVQNGNADKLINQMITELQELLISLKM